MLVLPRRYDPGRVSYTRSATRVMESRCLGLGAFATATGVLVLTHPWRDRRQHMVPPPPIRDIWKAHPTINCWISHLVDIPPHYFRLSSRVAIWQIVVRVLIWIWQPSVGPPLPTRWWVKVHAARGAAPRFEPSEHVKQVAPYALVSCNTTRSSRSRACFSRQIHMARRPPSPREGEWPIMVRRMPAQPALTNSHW